MSAVTPPKLTRQRFFEVKKVLDDYNNDKISLQQFIDRITGKEAESYEKMIKKANHNLELVEFADSSTKID